MMNKKAISLLLAGAMALSLAGCGTVGNSSAASAPAQSAAQSSDGKLEDQVVIYSTHPEDMLEEISQAFTKETGVKVEYINLKGELADRVASEMANPQADIMYGGDMWASHWPTAH